MKEQHKSSKINVDLSLIIMSVYAGGYILDFQDVDSQFVCLQNNRLFPAAGLQISIKGRYYDQLSKSVKDVYADTSGMKGLMLSNKSFLGKARSN
jgi:hypothetical protein